MKERNWVSIQSLSKRGYILYWFNGKKRPSTSALHFCFFYCAHLTLNLCMKFCRLVSKVMFFRLHLNKWNFRMSGPDARSLKLALIFTIFLYHVLTEAWRTKFSIRWGWEELTSWIQSWIQEICLPSVKEKTYSGHMCSVKREISAEMAQTQ